MAVRGILFDKDGTLLDLGGTWLPPYRQAAEFLSGLTDCTGMADSLMKAGGYDPDTGKWMLDSTLASGSNDEVLEVWEGRLGFPLPADTRAYIRETFFHASVRHVPAVDDLAGLIHGLRRRGLVLGLATMDDEAGARTMLKQFGLVESFGFVCGADSGFGVKPDPGMVHAFSDACALRLDDIMVVGDSPRDLHMARNAGAGVAVGVLSGAHDGEQLACDADILLDSIADLPRVLDFPVADRAVAASGGQLESGTGPRT